MVLHLKLSVEHVFVYHQELNHYKLLQTACVPCVHHNCSLQHSQHNTLLAALTVQCQSWMLFQP